MEFLARLTASRRRLRVVRGVAVAVIGLLSAAALGQTQSTGLREPTALVVHADSGHVFILEAGSGRLLRWNRETTEVLQDTFIADSSFSEVTALCLRAGNRLTAMGMAGNDRARVATFTVGVSVAAVEGLTRDLELEGRVKRVAAACTTDFAIYLVVVREDGRQSLWRIPAGRTSLGKPNLLVEEAVGTITSMTMSPRGHLVLAAQTETGAGMRFLHAETGRLLLKLQSDLQEVASLAFSPSGLLYAAGKKADREAVFRLDVFFDGARQAVRSTEMAKLDDVVGIDFSNQGECVVLVGGKQDGRALSVKMN